MNERSPLNSAATANLWEMTGKKHWNRRKDLLVEELKENGIENGNKAVLGFQESGEESIEIIAGLLDFPLDNVYMFPSGLALITDLKIKRESFQNFNKVKDNHWEIGKRGVGMLEAETGNKNLIIAVTHFTVSEDLQENNAIECISAIKNFALAGLDKDIANKLNSANLSEFKEFQNFLILGDLNSDPTTDAYIKFSQEGLDDATLKIRQKGSGFTWPVDVEWFLETYKILFNKHPGYEVSKQQRWMDYIWVSGLNPKDEKLLGTVKKQGLYPSDHSIPAVFF